MDTERLFLAIELPNDVRDLVIDRICNVAGRAEKVRWIPPSNIHLTLKFLGETSAAQKAEVTEAMERVVAKVGQFQVLISIMRIVRRRGRPHMVWATVSDAKAQLERLHGRIEHALEKSGFQREERPYSPHLTLARVREGIAPWEERLLKQWAEDQRDLAPIPFAVDGVTLIKSELKPGGAEYTACRRFELQRT
jgi:2'-5' RNA ligase